MANIDAYIEQIRVAEYGEEVRGSIINALTAENKESTDAYDAAIASQTSAQNSASAAANSATEANYYAGLATSAGTQSVKDIQDTAATAIATMTGYETRTKANADAAESSALRASTSEKNAKTSETNAKASENLVVTNATAAANSAAAAKTSETNAKVSETTAKSYLDDAKAYRDDASKYALSASTSATSASNAQTAASTSAADAQKSASDAKGYAEQAKAVAKIDIATDTTPGIVKPDGTTTQVDQFGAISVPGLTEHVGDTAIYSVDNPDGVHGIRVKADPATGLYTLQRWDDADQGWVDVSATVIVDDETLKKDTASGVLSVNLDGKTIYFDTVTGKIKADGGSVLVSTLNPNGMHDFRITHDATTDDVLAEFKGADGEWHELAGATKYIVNVTVPEACTVYFGDMSQSIASAGTVTFTVKDITIPYTYYAKNLDGHFSESHTIQITNIVTELTIEFDVATITISGTKAIKKASETMPGYVVVDDSYDLSENLVGYSVGAYDSGMSSPFDTQTIQNAGDSTLTFTFKPSEHPNVTLKAQEAPSELGRTTVSSSQGTEQLVFSNITTGSSLSGSFTWTEKWAELDVTTTDAELKSLPVALSYGTGKSITGQWDATDKCVFICKLPDISYTISCGEAPTETVNITSAMFLNHAYDKNPVNMAISKELVLYDNGNEYTTTTGGWTLSGGDGKGFTKESNDIRLTAVSTAWGDTNFRLSPVNTLPYSDYKYFKAIVNISKITGAGTAVWDGSAQTHFGSLGIPLNTDYEISIPIKSNTMAFVQYYVWYCEGVIKKVWLEP